MRLALPVTLFVGTFAAAAPSFQYTQISVDVAHPHVQNQADALHSSGKPVMNKDEPYHSSLPYNFTLIARNVHGRRLPFGFADLTLADGFARAELGYDTEFALRDEKLINGNRALEYHVAKVFPPWLSLWSLDLPHKYLDFAAFPNPLEGGGKYVLKLPAGPIIFGVKQFAQGEAVFIGPPDSHGDQVILEITAILNDDINADSTEELL